MKILFQIRGKQVREFLETLTIDQMFFIYSLLTDMDKDDAFELTKIFSKALDFNKSDSEKLGEMEDVLQKLHSEGITNTLEYRRKEEEVNKLKAKIRLKENIFIPKSNKELMNDQLPESRGVKSNLEINFLEETKALSKKGRKVK